VLERHVTKVEVNAFGKHIRGKNHCLPFRVDYSGIIANSFYRSFLFQDDMTVQMLNQSEFSQFFQFRAVVFIVKHGTKVTVQTDLPATLISY